MNYYIKFDNNFYNVVDGNTNQVIASFVSDIEANKFVQSLFGFANNQFNRMQPQVINPYSINPQYGMYPNQLPIQNPQFVMGQPVVQNPMQPNPYINQPQNPMQPNPFLQQPQMQQSPLNQNQPLKEQKEIEEPIENKVQNDVDVKDDLDLVQETAEEDIFEEPEFEESFQIDFNDNTLSIDSSLFEEDKMGAIIQQPNNFINNTDDDSLGEVSAYTNMEHVVQTEKPKEDEKEFLEEQPLGWDDIPDLEDDISFEEPVLQIQREEKAITEIYEENLIPESKVTSKKDDDLIDLGPVNEEDDIFSTPRKDAEQDDFEVFSLSKKERAELKKAKKREELSRKRYQKLLR